jgi:hypothetical protein
MVTTLILPAACMLHMHESLGGAFPKRHHVDCDGSATIRKVAILGCHTATLREQYPALYSIVRHKEDTIAKVMESSPLKPGTGYESKSKRRTPLPR